MRVSSVILVGMMGAGKSTVGKRLALRLGMQFIDADRELEQRCGATIPMIFEMEGEDGFRKRESVLIAELSLRSGIVLATGGGVVTRPENRAVLQANGVVVYLRANAQDLWVRLKRDNNRPMLHADDSRARMESLLDARIPLYESVATLTVDTGRRPVSEVIAAIVSKLPAELTETLSPE